MTNGPMPRTPSPIPDPEGRGDFLDLAGLVKLIADLRDQARKRVRSDEVEDLVSDVLLDLVKAVGRLEAIQRRVVNVGGLAFRILVRRVTRVLAGRSLTEHQGITAVADAMVAPEDEGAQQSRVAKLPRMGRRQTTLVAALLEGASMDSAAAKAGLPRKEADRVVRNLAARITRERKTEVHSTPKRT